MSLFLYPVSKSEIEGIKNAPSIYCPYGDMDTLLNFMLFPPIVRLGSHSELFGKGKSGSYLC